ncbi:MAG: ribbon-helix-helix domain-containing protein [Euryarchaeota archaeon]|nr:ribbon-helix-helix domain-containing protein [Euryarchaeota archaeon]
MERITIRLPRRQVEQIDLLVQDGEYTSKSEAIRQAIRELLTRHKPEVAVTDVQAAEFS